jgi:hypothetical protein
LAFILAGCSTAGQPESTAAIGGPAPAEAAGNGMAGADGSVQVGTQNGQVAVGRAVTLADASCDQIKAEMATFEADKIPQKLADFGKAKYHPTAEESIRFARYVDVSKAGKDKNCAPAKAMKKKQVTASKTPVDPASKKVTKAVGAAATATSATAAKVMPVVKAGVNGVPPAATTQPVDEGVTVPVPDSSG